MSLAPRPLPMSLAEARASFGWTEFDAILVTGDAYVDHPSFGAAIVGRWLERLGLRVGIIAQPDWHSTRDFVQLGRPRLFFGVTAGNLDSQLAHWTVMRRPRRDDHYTPGGVAGKRPDMATVVYCQKLREAFKQECPPLVIGGVEASLRRLAYYDYWTDTVKRPVILDAKADILVFGQGEAPLTALVQALRNPLTPDSLRSSRPSPHGGEGNLDGIAGTAVVRRDIAGIPCVLELPPWEGVSPLTAAGREQFARMFREYHVNGGPGGRPVAQKHGSRWVVVYPPGPPLTTAQLDEVYALPFTRRPHPSYGAARIPAYDMIKDSVTTHRGCYGRCAFCALSSHQGVAISSRSQANILREVEALAASPGFCGTISDLGGPTANMYGTFCKRGRAGCPNRNCLVPALCPHLNTDHAALLELMARARRVKGVKHVFIQSGIRFDLALSPGAHDYIEQLARHHVSGRLKIAPEHTSPDVLRHMQKCDVALYKEFLRRYAKASAAAGKDQYTVQYFISGHPGCTLEHMVELALFLKDQQISPEQVQDFYPAPLTLGMAMWHCGVNPLSGEPVYCAKTAREKRLQRALFFFRNPEYWPDVREALRECGREDLIGQGPQCLVPREKTRGKRRTGAARGGGEWWS